MFKSLSTSKPLVLTLLSLLLILIWGVGWPMITIGLPYCSPIWYATLRLIIATVCVFTIVPITDRLIMPKWKDFPLIFSIGFVQIGIFILLITLGMQYVPPGRSAIIAYIFPYFVTPIAVIFFGEKLTFGKTMGLLLGGIGIALLFSPWELDWHNPDLLKGNGLLVLSAVCWAGVMLHTRYAKWHRASHLLLPWQLLISIVPNLVLALIIDPHPQIHLNEVFLISMGYSGLLSSALAYWLLIIVSRELPVITMSLLLLAVPVVGLLSSAVMVGEKLSGTTLSSLALILIGLVFLFTRNSNEK